MTARATSLTRRPAVCSLPILLGRPSEWPPGRSFPLPPLSPYPCAASSGISSAIDRHAPYPLFPYQPEEAAMPRTPLAQRLRDAVSVVAEASASQIPPGAVMHERREKRLSRRGVMKAAAAPAGALAPRPR